MSASFFLQRINLLLNYKMLIEYSHFTELKGQGFSKDVCRSMIAMLDKDNSGGLGFEEFKSLWIDLRNWRVSFGQDFESFVVKPVRLG